MSIAVSACVICRNEAQRIAGCLDSLAWCKDIVVVDSGSTDGTPEMAEAHHTKPRVIRHDWLGFNQQRQFAAEQCQNQWVLMLDADEECSPELAVEILALRESDLERIGLMVMPRKNYLAGRYVRCWSPDFQSRLIHRDRVQWDPRPLPELRTPKSGFIEGHLKFPLLHGRLSSPSCQDFNDAAKMAAYADLLAGYMWDRGKRATYLNLLFRPYSTFFKYYILRGGFLDGRFGLAIAYKTTVGVMLKYSVLYGRELEEQQREGNASKSLKTPTTGG